MLNAEPRKEAPQRLAVPGSPATGRNAGRGQGPGGAGARVQRRRSGARGPSVAGALRVASTRRAPSRSPSGQLHEDQARERADRAGRRHALQLLLLLHLQDDSNQ